MADQLPHDYVQPVSSYSPKKQGLYLVAWGGFNHASSI
jgi:hypothetical protein